MRFKDYLRLEEEQSGADHGLMGFGVQPNHKPSDGQPFKDFLNSVAGAKGTPAGSMGGGSMPAFGKMMRKRMKRK